MRAASAVARADTRKRTSHILHLLRRREKLRVLNFCDLAKIEVPLARSKTGREMSGRFRVSRLGNMISILEPGGRCEVGFPLASLEHIVKTHSSPFLGWLNVYLTNKPKPILHSGLPPDIDMLYNDLMKVCGRKLK
jgi:hypothetical protein